MYQQKNSMVSCSMNLKINNMGLNVKKNIKGEYKLTSTISDELLHDEDWISEKEAIKILIERQWFRFVEETIKIYMEFPSGYHVNNKHKFIKGKAGSGSRWVVDNWDDGEKINEKFGEICKELDIKIDTIN